MKNVSDDSICLVYDVTNPLETQASNAFHQLLNREQQTHTLTEGHSSTDIYCHKCDLFQDN